MNRIQCSSFRGLLALFALTGLLLQAQLAFACRMMETAGPTQDCCCVEKLQHNYPAVCDEAASCCDFSLELHPYTLNAGWAPLPGSLPFDHTPTHLTIAHRWADGALTPSVLTKFHHLNPSSPGTQTYLATLRLRI